MAKVIPLRTRVRIDGDLPFNLDSERELLGALMRDNPLVFEVIDILTQADFFDRGHGELFILIVDQVHANRPATAATLLHDQAQDRDMGGMRVSQYLRKLEENAAPSVLARELARSIRDLSIRRAIIGASEEAITRALDAPVTVTAEELRGEIDTALSGLYRSFADLGMRSLGEISKGIIAKMDRKVASGYAPGLVAVESLMGVFLPGRVYTLGALPGAGKSALAQQLCQHVGRNGIKSILFSPEMEAEEIAERALSSVTGIAAEDIERGGSLNADQKRRLIEADESLSDSGLIIDATANPSVAMIRNRVKRMQSASKVGLVAIDHALYLSPPLDDSRARESDAVDANMRAIKRMAKELEVPVLVLTQFTTEGIRELNKWPHPKPGIGHLLYAGIFDRHSDVIMLLHRAEAVLARNRPDDKNAVDHASRLNVARGFAELILTKARGRRGDGHQEFAFNAKRLRFTDDKREAMLKSEEELAEEKAFFNRH